MQQHILFLFCKKWWNIFLWQVNNTVLVLMWWSYRPRRFQKLIYFCFRQTKIFLSEMLIHIRFPMCIRSSIWYSKKSLLGIRFAVIQSVDKNTSSRTNVCIDNIVNGTDYYLSCLTITSDDPSTVHVVFFCTHPHRF